MMVYPPKILDLNLSGVWQVSGWCLSQLHKVGIHYIIKSKW